MIDLRSDTVTQPTEAMREMMLKAEVGDDVYGEDTTINLLQATLSEMLGKEAALFVPTGTQSNLLALLSHCERGDEYIAGQHAHIYCEEGGGGAVLASVQPQPVDNEADGSLDLEKVAAAIKNNDDFHFAKTRLLCLENTMWGRVLDLDYLQSASQLAKKNKLSTHLDGARFFNAVVELGVAPQEMAEHFDSVSICLSKGLGAPVGSVLCGNKKLIEKARRWRKVVGGAMRQAGVLAAAGLYALNNHVERLKDDHQLAYYLAEQLAEMEEVNLHFQATNMVFFDLPNHNHKDFGEYLKKQDILILSEDLIRLVTHLNVTKEDIDEVLLAIKQFFCSSS